MFFYGYLSLLGRLFEMVLEAVVFDLGGTLVYLDDELDRIVADGHRALAEYLNRSGHRVGLQEVREVSVRVFDAYSVFAETSLADVDARVLYRSLLRHLGVWDFTDEFLVGAVMCFYASVTSHYVLYEDALEVLTELRNSGLKLGMITDNSSVDSHEFILGRFGLHRFFDSILVSSRVGVRKPHKAIFMQSLRELGVEAADAVYVGDAPERDVVGAVNAGMKSIWVDRGDKKVGVVKPDWTVTSLRQVAQTVRTLV